jgi:hypothetical protein
MVTHVRATYDTQLSVINVDVPDDADSAFRLFQIPLMHSLKGTGREALRYVAGIVTHAMDVRLSEGHESVDGIDTYRVTPTFGEN